MHELALFAGAGGGILGGKLLGWHTVCAVEWDPYARDVLVARQNDGCLAPFPIWDDIQTFDGRPWRGLVDVVSGGFPCQDISAAGKGAGIEGERSGMWWHMARVIGEVLPRFVLVENSPMLVGRGLAVVLGDLAQMGYDARWGIVGAHHAGAPHKRDRIWIVAYPARIQPGRKIERTNRERIGSGGESIIVPNADGLGFEGGLQRDFLAEGGEPASWRGDVDGSCEAVADSVRNGSEAGIADSQGGEEGEPAIVINGGGIGAGYLRAATSARLPNRATVAMGESGADAEHQRSDWWLAEPDVGRVAHGVAARVDRLRCIGNGQVPSVVHLAWQVLNDDAAF